MKKPLSTFERKMKNPKFKKAFEKLANKRTRQAIAELEAGKGKRVNNIKDLMKDLKCKNKTTPNSLKQIEKITGIKLTFGKIIWAIRRSDSITQVEFAKKLHITTQKLRDIEHDRISVSPTIAEKFAKILKYSPAQFIRLAKGATKGLQRGHKKNRL